MKLVKLLLACVFTLAASTACADAWPSRPIRFVVAAPGGSSLDIIARTIGDKLKERLGQPVVIDNVPGASGTIASGNVVRAAPDGHTLLMSFNGPLAFTQFLTSLPYDPQKDLTPVIQTSSQPNVLVVNNAVPARTVSELIAHIKANPGKLNYASVGNGSSSHLTMELFKSAAGLFVVHIPYNGAPPAALSVAAGDTQMLFTVPSVVMPHLRSGKLRALAVTSGSRFPLMPDLPTIAESGLPKFESMTWNGVLVPAKTPAEIVQRLNRDIDAILKMPDVKARLHAAGLEPSGGSPEQFKALIASEAKKWSEIIKRTGAKLD
ncbi:tripartite tricarboxylate transporter substrate binding protein [Herbaspirillum sp. HC18]|nr:tripartite tricarboxylate transporter substrate binding protein [Herbaspirillum sp. HC18]